MSDVIFQEVRFAAAPQTVFDALTTGAVFAAATAAPADIEARAGGAFSCFGGKVTGCNIELVPGQRLVQAWRVGNWDDGVYSIVRFELAPEGAGTRLRFSQTGHPTEHAPHLAEGWPRMYWEPLTRHLSA